MSAIGSVIFLNLVVPCAKGQGMGPRLSPWARCPLPDGLPTTLRHPGDVPLQRELTEAEAAERELSEIRARTPAAAAAVAQPDLVLRRLGLFGDLRCRGHLVRLS